MQKNRFADAAKCNSYRLVFTGTVTEIVNKGIPALADRRLGFSQTEALLVGVATNLEQVQQMMAAEFGQRMNDFLNIGSLSSEELRNDISSKERVNRRIDDSIKVFA